jgi:hypothetical protein
MRRVGERHDSAFMPLRTTAGPGIPGGRAANITVNPAYTWLGFSGECELRDGFSLYLRVDNLTGADFESALGYPGQPRATVVGGRFDLTRR